MALIRLASPSRPTAPRTRVLHLLDAGLDAVRPERLLPAALAREGRRLVIQGETFDLPGRLFVIGGGKAAIAMALAAEAALGTGAIEAGLVIAHADGPARPATVAVRVAGHPEPDARGAAAVEEMLALKSAHGIGPGDTVLCLLSGGASALMPAPDGISLEGKREVTRLLLGAGLDIRSMNAVRRALSRVKGGGLGRHFAPARVLTLIISDVIGNDLSAIGSGPTAGAEGPDPVRTLRERGLWDGLPAAARRKLEAWGPPPPGPPPNCRNFILADGGTALRAMAGRAESLGLRPLAREGWLQGEPADRARDLAGEFRAGAIPPGAVWLASGETAPALPPGPGRGGRNRHWVLCLLRELASYPGPWTAASLGTDGADYTPDAAGALADSGLAARAPAGAMAAAIAGFDSGGFFERSGDGTLATGPTGTNVGDLAVFLPEA